MRTGQLTLIAVLVCGLQLPVVGQTGPARGPSGKRSGPPAVSGVLSVKSYDALRTLLAYLSTVSGQPQLPHMLDSVIKSFTRGQGLLGIDTKKPFGVALLTYGANEPRPLVFVPVNDQEKVLQLLQVVVPLIMKKFGPVPYKLTDSWFLVGSAFNHIHESDMPSPSRLVDSNVWKYDIALTSNLGNIPMVKIKAALKQLDHVAERPILGKGAAYRQGQIFGAMVVKSIAKLVVGGARRVTLGLNVSPKQKKIALELTLSSKRGTDLDRLIGALSQTPSRLAGLVDPAGLGSILLNIPLNRDAKLALLSLMPSTGEANQVLLSTRRGGRAPTPERELLSLLRKTVESGRLETALSFRGNPPGPLTLAGSIYLADAKSIERFLIEQIDIDRRNGRLEFQPNMSHLRTVPIHEIRTPAFSDLKKYFGATPKLHFAAGGNILHVAFGALSLDSIKWAIDRTSSSRRYSNRFSPFLLQGRVRPWLTLASKQRPELARLEPQIPANEHVSIVVTPSPGSLRTRLEFQEGLLRLIGSQAAQGSKSNRSFRSRRR